AESAAILYGALALVVLALSWRDARWGLLFVSGPLLAGVGLLAILPLAVQPARGVVRRAMQAGLAVLAALLVAGVAGDELPIEDRVAETVGIGPADAVSDAALSVWGAIAMYPATLAVAALVAVAAGILPSTRRFRYGVAAIGALLTIAAIGAGAGFASAVAVALAWSVAATVAAASRRPS
ncbi:MAG: hypothetical protein ACRDOF_07055, partial [Gaiellaceae bacterium]